MKRILPFIIVLILTAACGSQREVAENPLADAPEWVQNRPLSSSYYIGVGIAPKSPGANVQATAKKNALSDLASEIKVNVNSNSLLYTLEENSNFEQEFRESIRTTSNLDLEDFEIVDTWQDANSYWVYYRLNKAAYAESQRAKKEAAQALALDFLGKADAERSQGHFSNAADYYLRGLQAIEDFWNEENRVDYLDTSILLDNTLFTSLKDLLTSPEIICEEEIEINFQNRYSTSAVVRVKNSTGQTLENVPLTYSYYGTYGRLNNHLRTNADGKVEIPVVNADKTRPNNPLEISVDTENIFSAFQSDPFMRKLTQTMRGASVEAPITYKPPVVYLISEERNLGKKMSSNPLEAAVSTSLNRHGMRLSNTPNQADLILKLNADTKKSGTSNGFASAQLSFSISVEESTGGENRYRVSRSDVKGVDLNYEKAGLKAYQNLTGNIESELMRPLVNDLF